MKSYFYRKEEICMKKKLITALLITACIFVNGCGPKEVNDYPTGIVNSEKDSQNKETPSHVNDSFTSKNGKVEIKIDADVIGSINDEMPVYEIEKKNYSGEELNSMCKKIFKEGSINYLIPLEAADSSYLNDRQAIVEMKKKFYTDAQRDIPLSVIFEEEQIKNIISEESEDNVNIKLPETPDWIDMTEYYKETDSENEEELKFFAAEGIIDEDYWEFYAVESRDNMSIRLYKKENDPNVLERFGYESDENTPYYLKLDSWVTKDEAIEYASEFMAKIGLEGFGLNCVDSVTMTKYEANGKHSDNPVFLHYGGNDEAFSAMKVSSYEDFGYQVTFSRIYGNSMQLYDTYSDYVGGYLVSKSIPTLTEIPYLQNYDSIFLERDEITAGGCYESVSMGVDEEGVFSFMWSSPTEVKELKTDKSVMLEFDKVLDCAETAIGLMDDDELKEYKNIWDKIDTIELMMARVRKGGKYTMVPAWYFVGNGAYSSCRRATLVCINAIDGSIIDVKNGGIISEP